MFAGLVALLAHHIVARQVIGEKTEDTLEKSTRQTGSLEEEGGRNADVTDKTLQVRSRQAQGLPLWANLGVVGAAGGHQLATVRTCPRLTQSKFAGAGGHAREFAHI